MRCKIEESKAGIEEGRNRGIGDVGFEDSMGFVMEVVS